MLPKTCLRAPAWPVSWGPRAGDHIVGTMTLGTMYQGPHPGDYVPAMTCWGPHRWVHDAGDNVPGATSWGPRTSDDMLGTVYQSPCAGDAVLGTPGTVPPPPLPAVGVSAGFWQRWPCVSQGPCPPCASSRKSRWRGTGHGGAGTGTRLPGPGSATLSPCPAPGCRTPR